MLDLCSNDTLYRQLCQGVDKTIDMCYCVAKEKSMNKEQMYATVLKKYATHTAQQLADELGVTRTTVLNAVKTLRRKGFNIPYKETTTTNWAKVRELIQTVE